MLRIAGTLVVLLMERLVARFSHLNLWQWIGIQTLLFTLVPIALIILYETSREEVGLSTGDLRLGLKYVAIMLVLAMPFMFYGASLPSFKAYYPIWEPARTSILSFILLELAVFVMIFNTEFLFRGLLLFSFERNLKNVRRGRLIAIFIHSLIYMAVHFGKPGLEVPYSFFVGLVFGWLALKTRSVLPSFIAHWTSSVIFDILVIIL
jgi:membrane protease YdiL (CAAX protease family)